MFVRQSKYEELLKLATSIIETHELLAIKHDNLVKEIDAKGGAEFLKSAVILDPKLLRDLKYLCHPDKHSGSALSYKVLDKLKDL